MVANRCNEGFVLQASPKTMNIKLDTLNENLLREMVRKNSRYGSVHPITNEAEGSFYASVRK